jgi:hypothetical protein
MAFAPSWAAAGAGSFTMADFAAVDKVDIHVHINTSDTALIDQAAADNFRLLTINVDYPDFPPLSDQQRIPRRWSQAIRNGLPLQRRSP